MLPSQDEKMSDLEQLKSQVRADLLTITDGANASAILSTLDTDDLKFLAQKFELMAKEIRPKYKLGITQPQFSDFLESYMKYEAKNPIAGRDTGRADMGVALQRINASFANTGGQGQEPSIQEVRDEASRLGVSIVGPGGGPRSKKNIMSDLEQERSARGEAPGGADLLSPLP